MSYFRNKIALISYEGIAVDAASLWIRRGELMVLVDEDQYVTCPYSEKKFYFVEL
ncbi:MAG: hypothetical protein ACOH1X_02930 [Kaistella sp.]